MSYPQSSWQPAPVPPPHVHVADYAYGGPAGGARAWPYAVPPGHGHAYAPYAQAQGRPQEQPPKDDYWATELQENPLGLENMHIRAESGMKESISANAGTSRVPSSSSYLRASDVTQRNSYPPKSSTKATLAPSKSHPNTRAPSPARPRHRERDAAGGAQYVAYPEAQMPGQTSNGNGSHAAMHHRPPSRAYGGRTSVPVESADRYSSASASAAQMAATASRAQTLPGAAHRRHASAVTPGPGQAQAQGMQRARTLPADALAMGMARTAQPIPRRISERYDYRYPADDDDDDDDDEEEGEEEGEDGEDGEEYIFPTAARPAKDKAKEAAKEQKKERSSMDRVRAWIDGARRAGSSERDRDREAKGKASAKSRSKSHRSAPADDYDEQQEYGVRPESAAHFVRERGQERDEVLRHASAPDPMHGPPAMAIATSQNQNANFAGFGISGITEEPEDMRRYYQSQQQCQQQSQQRRQQQRQSPYQGRERPPPDDVSSSESSSSSSASADEFDRPLDRPLDRRRSLRDREQRQIRTPHPAQARRLLERSDTLRVDDSAGAGMGTATATQAQAHLPSPRSLRQSSRTPSARPSYEQVHAERERERTKSPNGHLTTGQSSASAAAGMYGYGTPPITPTRQEYAHRADVPRSPYAPQPSSAAAVAAVDPAPGFQTPARLAYLYRGNSASPSPPSHRAASTQPYAQPQPQAYSQQSQQYGGYAVAEPKPKKRSPHASRSPSPLPPGQSSSSAYYAAPNQALTPSRAHSRSRSSAHGPSHSHNHSHAHTAVQPSAQAPTHDGRRRSSSRAGGSGGYSSASGAAAAAAGSARHVRAGFWNRRGDHLTASGHVVYCPPGRNYPRDLADYPDAAFQDHYGRIVADPPDAYPELPESVPQSAGRAPEKGYDSFVKYVLVGNS